MAKNKSKLQSKKMGSSNWDKLRVTMQQDNSTVKRPGKRKRPTKPLQNITAVITSNNEEHSSELTVEDKPESIPRDTLSDNITHRLALDCEMVGSGKDGADNQLARVSVVNVFGDAVYDKIVQPREPVTDYRQHITGLNNIIIKQSGQKFKIVQNEVGELLKDKVIIGHDLKHDFEVLGFSHPKHLIRDTSKYKPFKKLSKGNTPSLKKLCREILNKDIHDGVHDSVVDARTALNLYKRHRAAWERHMKKKKRAAQVLPPEATLSDTDEDPLED